MRSGPRHNGRTPGPRGADQTSGWGRVGEVLAWRHGLTGWSHQFIRGLSEPEVRAVPLHRAQWRAPHGSAKVTPWS
jgi:hypothetical protein